MPVHSEPSYRYSNRSEIPEAGDESPASQGGCVRPKATVHTDCGIPETMDVLIHGDESILAAYVDRLAGELVDTRSEQSRLNKKLEQLSETVEMLRTNIGGLAHGQDQLDAKVRSMGQEVEQVRQVSRSALERADDACRSVQELREETTRRFGEVARQLASLAVRLDQLIAGI